MSGPKVFHVVTREEIISICDGHLARLDAAVAEWNRACGRNGAARQQDVDAVLARRDALRQMLTDERFVELQKQVPAEVSFLTSDTKERVERVSAAAVEARQALRRTARTARMLLESLDRQRLAVPEALRAKLHAATAPASELDAAISSAFALLASGPAYGGVTARQRELAESLGRGEKRATLSDWLASQPAPEDDGSSLKIDRYLVELSELGIDPSPFEARAAAISGNYSSRRGLLADSLLLDLAGTVKEGRKRAGVLANLRERNAELSRFTSEAAQALRAEMDRIIATRDAAPAPDLIQRADALIGEEIRLMAAAARRRVVLRGLASLGYEVTEGMATAWVEDGRVVLRKAANRDYGVELAGGAKSDRLQVRAVGFGSPGAVRDTSRDRDMETIWCDEFSRLQALVSDGGGEVGIDDARPVGAVPIKVIEDARDEDTSQAHVPARQNVLR